ncbi:hypothetical protein CYY_000567 [Polysphondylium violaceum]|uniref:UbiA prenyltransferase family protein n=1 Tax=Polysphondylium violaceum TaxID=133409 RepID=A0A8J4Q1I3_9MYCE|nr:hypothetical protein CYY_000567 [Polysphondylium violaceum]
MEYIQINNSKTVVQKYQDLSKYLNDYFKAGRPWTLLFIMAGNLLGLAVCCKQGYSFMVVPFILSVFMTVNSLYFANLINTYFDYQVTKDETELGDFDLTDIVGFVSFSLFLSFVFFISMMCFIPNGNLMCYTEFLICFLSVLFSGYAYTAPPFALKYRALGEIGNYPFFMVIPTLYFSQTGLIWNQEILEYSLIFFIYCLTPLHANNHRDREIDMKHGAKTISNLLGETLSFYLYFVYHIIALIGIVYLSFKYHNRYLLLPLFGIPSIWNIYMETRSGVVIVIRTTTMARNKKEVDVPQTSSSGRKIIKPGSEEALVALRKTADAVTEMEKKNLKKQQQQQKKQSKSKHSDSDSNSSDDEIISTTKTTTNNKKKAMKTTSSKEVVDDDIVFDHDEPKVKNRKSSKKESSSSPLSSSSSSNTATTTPDTAMKYNRYYSPEELEQIQKENRLVFLKLIIFSILMVLVPVCVFKVFNGVGGDYLGINRDDRVTYAGVGSVLGLLFVMAAYSIMAYYED